MTTNILCVTIHTMAATLRQAFDEILSEEHDILDEDLDNIMELVEERDHMILSMINKLLASNGGGNWKEMVRLTQDELRKRLHETRG